MGNPWTSGYENSYNQVRDLSSREGVDVMRSLRLVVLAVALVLLMASVAQAHAVVYPQQARADSYEKFALRVPSEKDVPTVKVRVEIPGGFAISRVQPMTGWTYAFEKDSAGKVTAIVWSGGEIGPTEFQEFVFQGKTAKDPGKYAFRAIQTYKDGSVAEWTGPADAKTPASQVELVAAAGKADDHGNETGVPAGQSAAPAPAPAAAGGFTPIAAYGGLVLGALALVLALRRGSR